MSSCTYTGEFCAMTALSTGVVSLADAAQAWGSVEATNTGSGCAFGSVSTRYSFKAL
ncbi:hypothetical protein D3C80_1255220 [compost metagenome]